MEITGFDSQYVVDGELSGRLQRFAEYLQQQWPSLVVSVGWSPPVSVQWLSAASALGRADASKDVLFFARDAAMVKHFDEHSYTPLSDGSGVVAISYAALDLRELPVLVPETPTELTGVTRQAYAATFLILGRAFQVQLLTPEAPITGSFSAMVSELFVASFHVRRP